MSRSVGQSGGPGWQFLYRGHLGVAVCVIALSLKEKERGVNVCIRVRSQNPPKPSFFCCCSRNSRITFLGYLLCENSCHMTALPSGSGLASSKQRAAGFLVNLLMAHVSKALLAILNAGDNLLKKANRYIAQKQRTLASCSQRHSS